LEQVKDYISQATLGGGTRKERKSDRKAHQTINNKQYGKEQYAMFLILFSSSSYRVQAQRRIQVDFHRSKRGRQNAGQSGVHQDLCYLSL
jgi:hypothetical protein